MTELWTGKEFKEEATEAEIRNGLNHLVDAMQGLRNKVRPDLPLAEAKALLENIDRHIAVYNANVAALEPYEVRSALADRAAIIDGLESPASDEASKA